MYQRGEGSSLVGKRARLSLNTLCFTLALVLFCPLLPAGVRSPELTCAQLILKFLKFVSLFEWYPSPQPNFPPVRFVFLGFSPIERSVRVFYDGYQRVRGCIWVE